MQISPDTLKLIMSAVKNGTATILEAIGSSSKVISLTPGTVITGEVLARQSNGRHIVSISGELMEMALPGEIPVGGALKMTYVGDKPRLTFAVSAQTLKGADVSISSAGRWLGRMATESTESSTPESARNVRTARMFDSLPAESSAIAVRLKEIVSRSGVFYESHLERWTKGEYPLKELLREPQGEQSPLAHGRTDTQPAAGSRVPDSQTLPAVRQQLEVLNSGQFVWRGEPWQGQSMEWTIRRDAQRKGFANARSWDTTLTLELPGLGKISASVSIAGNQVRLSVAAAEADTAEKMNTHRNRLIEGMESGGLLLGGLEVRHDASS